MADETPNNVRKSERHLAAERESAERRKEYLSRMAKLEARRAVRAAIATARSAPPPWDLEGWAPTLPHDDQPEERLRKARELLKDKWTGVKWHWKNIWDFEPGRRKEPIKSMSDLKTARKKMKKLASVVTEEAFTWWHDTCLKEAESPDKWTQSAVLYEHYLKVAKGYGNNMNDKRLSKEELASITTFGKMMGNLHPNKRRSRAGWFYPVRIKRGA